MSHNANDQNSFDMGKAIAAIAYIVEHATSSMYSVMKMLYIADKMHLERYGRFIFGDSYAAMKQGPVPSSAYNMIKHVRGDAGYEEFANATRYLGYRDEFEILIRERPDYDELSGTDIRCLDEITNIYRDVGKWAVRDMSHDQAWIEAWRAKPFYKRCSDMTVELIAKQLENPEALLAHLDDPFPGEASKPIAARSFDHAHS